MGWSFRRSLNFGPVRLNFGKRGVGVSAGVRGARIGVDSQQRPYVGGGAGGFYYREYLKRARQGPQQARLTRGVGSIVVLLTLLALAAYMIHRIL